jgi:hypothetical protein
MARFFARNFLRMDNLELDAKSVGIAVGANATANTVPPIPPPAAMSNSIAERHRIEIDSIISAAGLIFRSIESYLHELINASLRSQLQSLGITVNATETNPASSLPIPSVLTARAVPGDGAGRTEGQTQSNGGLPLQRRSRLTSKTLSPHNGRKNMRGISAGAL